MKPEISFKCSISTPTPHLAGLDQALRYDVEAGSPLYAEVFRRLVRNEGLKAVLDLAPRRGAWWGDTCTLWW